MSATAVTAVIPTLNETAALPPLLAELDRLGVPAVVVDGGSTDATTELAEAAGARVVRSAPGRARQLRAGAEVAKTPWLFFVHADTRLEDAGTELLSFVAKDARDRFGIFGLTFDHPAIFYRCVEWGQRLRDRRTGLAYGDQGIVVSRDLYDEVGGYPDWPMLEDVEMVRRLAAVGQRVSLDARLTTSARRYEARGRWAELAANVRILIGYARGVSPHELARKHPRRPEPARRDMRERVIVFAKAPRPGFAKTRLAADVGTQEAMRIYRALGSETVTSLSSRYAVTIFHDVPDPSGLAEIQAWLGPNDYRPQTGESLGARMIAAFAESFEEAERICIVGTDVPGLDSGVVEEAFARLSEADVVIGPAADGGYYLLATERFEPALFEDVPWSTPEVLLQTLERARNLGLRVHLLAEMADVDRGDDVPARLRTA